MKKSLRNIIIALMTSSLLYADTSSLTLENDAIIGKDNHYTNGLYYTWISDENTTFPDVLSFIRLKQKNIAFSISHGIFTPQNKEKRDRDLNDLPYAGYLNLNFLAYKSSSNLFHELGVSIGMIGPSTQAGTLQKGFHGLIGHEKPKGWDNQLSNHVLYGLSYGVGYKTNPLQIKNLNLDFTSNLRGNLGNFYTGALIGASLRLSSTPLKSFKTMGNFIGANETQFLNYKVKKRLNWALSFGIYYNKYSKFYLVDEAIDEGYHLSKIDHVVGEQLSLDLYDYSYKISFYIKSIDIHNDYKPSSHNEKTGGVNIVWKF